MGGSRRRRQREARQAARRRSGPLAALDSVGGPFMAIAIVVAVFAVGGLIAVGRGGGDEPPFEPIVRSEVSGSHAGAASAPVRIIEFVDFQCGACGRFATELEPLIAAEFIETGIASLEIRHFPFLGAESFAAAEASECALDQGRFWEYHDLLFQRQGAVNSGVFSTDRLRGYGREVAERFPDFDVEVFELCVDSRAKRAVVQAQLAEGQALGVGATPSFLIGGQLLRGVPSLDDFRALIRRVAQAEAN